MNAQGNLADSLNKLGLSKIPSARVLGVGLLVLLGTPLVWSAVFTVEAEEVGIVLTFGKYTRDAGPGLRFKWPWPIETVRRFDRRLQTFDPPAREIHTKKKRNIVVDAYICWRIAPSASGR